MNGLGIGRLIEKDCLTCNDQSIGEIRTGIELNISFEHSKLLNVFHHYFFFRESLFHIFRFDFFEVRLFHIDLRYLFALFIDWIAKGLNLTGFDRLLSFESKIEFFR